LRRLADASTVAALGLSAVGAVFACAVVELLIN
jgi:hypothetical protein